MADTAPGLITPSESELARTKRWASLQNPPVKVEIANPVGFETDMYKLTNLPEWVWDGEGLEYGELESAWINEPLAWKYLALALRPIFNSVQGVLFEEAAKVVENGSFLHDQSPAKLFATQAAAAIRRFAAGETTC